MTVDGMLEVTIAVAVALAMTVLALIPRKEEQNGVALLAFNTLTTAETAEQRGAVLVVVTARSANAL